MASKRHERVVFYSKTDMAVGPNLTKVEKLLSNLDLSAELSIIDLLELYHVKLYFDSDLYSLNWSDEVKKTYQVLIGETWILIRKYWLDINSSNIIEHVTSLDYNYKDSFWELIEYFKVYKNINKPIFEIILAEFSYQITYVLERRDIVQHFEKEIKDFLMKYSKTAELLLSNIEQKHTSDHTKYFFPASLKLADREIILERYLDHEEVNLNYVRLIEKSRDSPQLQVSEKLRLKAKRKSIALNNQIMEDAFTWKEGVQVAIDKDQVDPVIFSRNNGVLEVSYSEDYLNDRTSAVSLFQVFRRLFGYLDNTALITLVSKESELDVIERVIMQSKNEYVTGTVFLRKRILSDFQLVIYEDYLKRRELCLEQIIESVINVYFKEQFAVNLKFKFPSKSATYIEKIRMLAPELEFLLRQYKTYVDTGEIDFELLQISTKPLWYSEIGSLAHKKYVYSNNKAILRLKYLFFSDQCLLHYVEPFKSKYSKLYDLLINENVGIDQFANYQKPEIEKLILEGYLMLDNNNIVRLKRSSMLYLIGELHSKNFISYWHYSDTERETLDRMATENLVTFENTLLTREELNYFNYYLNKKEFTNGYDLRNKYMHGTNPASENEHQSEYYMLLKIIILAVLKIDDDLILRSKFL